MSSTRSYNDVLVSLQEMRRIETEYLMKSVIQAVERVINDVQLRFTADEQVIIDLLQAETTYQLGQTVSKLVEYRVGQADTLGCVSNQQFMVVSAGYDYKVVVVERLRSVLVFVRPVV